MRARRIAAHVRDDAQPPRPVELPAGEERRHRPGEEHGVHEQLVLQDLGERSAAPRLLQIPLGRAQAEIVAERPRAAPAPRRLVRAAGARPPGGL